MLHPYASFGRRLAAYFIDVFVCLLIPVLTGLVYRLVHLGSPSNSVGLPPDVLWQNLSSLLKLLVLFAFLLCIGPLYYVLCESSSWQATFGKRALNIYVSGPERQRVSITRAFGRWIVKLASIWMFPFLLISMVLVIATPDRRALHDHVASTYVQNGRTTAGLETWRLAVALLIPFVYCLALFLILF